MLVKAACGGEDAAAEESVATAVKCEAGAVDPVKIENTVVERVLREELAAMAPDYGDVFRVEVG